MKKHLFLLLWVIGFNGSVFCQFPADNLSQQVEKIYIELGSGDIFSLNQFVFGDCRADNAEVGGAFGTELPDLYPYMLYEPPENVSALQKYWFRGYTIVSICNSIVESAPGSGLDEAVIQRYIAEAKFIRSLVIFTLANTFGAIPYPAESYDWPMGGTFYDYLATNKVPDEAMSLHDIYEQLETDLTEVIGNLPARSELDEENNFRVTSGAAKALLGKVLLYGSCFAANYSGDARFEGFTEQRFDDALTWFEEVINSGEYELLSGEYDTWWSGSPLYPGQTPAYRALFNASQNGCAESVFSLRNLSLGSSWRPDRGLAHTMYSTVRYYIKDGFEENLGWGVNIPSYDLMDAFEQETGTVSADDPRFAVTVGQEEDSVITYDTNWYPMTFTTDVFSANRKWECSPGEFWNVMNAWLDSPLDLPLIRYADVLLMAAEAALLTGDSAKALTYTNSVRQRARESGQSGKPGDLATITYEDIMLERRVELAMEGQRFYDLLRWGLLYGTLNGKYITTLSQTATFIEGQHEFLPYSDTLIASPFIVRNLQSEGPVNLFPNPGNGKVFIQSDEVITSLKVNTIQGKEICRAKGIQVYGLSIDLSGIEPGIYLITLQNNKRSVTCRYIKQ